MFYDPILEKYQYTSNELITINLISNKYGESRLEIPKQEIKNLVKEILEENRK